MRKLMLLILTAVTMLTVAEAAPRPDDWRRHSDYPRHSVRVRYHRRPVVRVYRGPVYAYPRYTNYRVYPRRSEWRRHSGYYRY